MTSLAPFAVDRRDAWQEGSGRRRQEPQGSQGGLALVPFSPTSTPALPTAPASSSPVPLGHSLTTLPAMSNLLTSASDVPSAPEECSVYLFFT